MTADGKCRVTFTPDRNWLNEASRKFPVVIDPVTTTSKAATDIEDAYISSKIIQTIIITMKISG